MGNFTYDGVNLILDPMCPPGVIYGVTAPGRSAQEQLDDIREMFAVPPGEDVAQWIRSQWLCDAG